MFKKKRRKKSTLGGAVSKLYRLARNANNADAVLTGRTTKRLTNIAMGKNLFSRFWR